MYWYVHFCANWRKTNTFNDYLSNKYLYTDYSPKVYLIFRLFTFDIYHVCCLLICKILVPYCMFVLIFYLKILFILITYLQLCTNNLSNYLDFCTDYLPTKCNPVLITYLPNASLYWLLTYKMHPCIDFLPTKCMCTDYLPTKCIRVLNTYLQNASMYWLFAYKMPSYTDYLATKCILVLITYLQNASVLITYL